MKLTIKVVTVFFLCILAVSAIFAWIAIRWEEQAFEQRATAQAIALGEALQDQIPSAYDQHGEEGIVRIVRQIDDADHRWQLEWIQTKSFEPGFGRDHGELTSQAIRNSEGNPEAFIYLYTIALDDNRFGQLEILKDLDELEENKRNAIEKIIIFAIAQVLVLGLITFLFGIRFIDRPVRQLIEKTRKISQGNLSENVALNSRDELGELARSINLMCDQLSSSQNQVHEEAAARVAAVEQLRHADRLRTVGRLASGLAHELGTPLNVVAGRASLIGSGKLTSEQVVESSQTIRKEADRMTVILRQLLDFARRTPPQTAAADLRQVVSGAIDMLTPLAEKANVNIAVTAQENAYPIQVDAEQFRQVVTNLVMNAIQSMPEGGEINVEITKEIDIRPPKMVDGETVPERDAAYYCLKVSDQGAGIAEENIEHLFEPFFTTKGVGEGTGLGLSISYGIIKEHGGWIDVSTTLGKGSCFFVFIPAEA